MRIIYIFILFLLHSFLFANTVNLNSSTTINLLPQSKTLFAHDSFDINSTTSRSNFKDSNNKSLIVTGNHNNLWIDLDVNTKDFKEPLLTVSSPLLTKLKIYDQNGTLLRDLGYTKRQQLTLLPYFQLKEHSAKSLYLQLQSRYIPATVSVVLQEKENFLKNDAKMKFLNALALGALATLLLFLLLYLYYSRKREILYFTAFIVTLIYFQFTYVGFTRIFTMHHYALLDLSISSVKINLITIALFFYSVSLLNIASRTLLYNILKLLAIIAGVEILIVGFINMSPIYALIPLIGVLIIATFALLKSIVVSKQIEHIFPFFGYLLLFGQFATTFFAPLQTEVQQYSLLITTLAIVLITMNYILHFIRKQKCDSDLLLESHERKYMLEKMLQGKKDELDALNKAKEHLTHNIHTIIENNLNKIVTSIQAQGSSADLSKLSMQLATTEQRMQATSICYTHMLSNKDLTKIEMQSVIDEIIDHIKRLYNQEECRADIRKDIDATLPLNDAIMAATAISEYLMDGFKNACEHNRVLRVSITLKNSQKSYRLNIKEFPKEEHGVTTTPLQRLKEKLQQLRGGVQ